jgi:hypothetical protein
MSAFILISLLENRNVSTVQVNITGITGMAI